MESMDAGPHVGTKRLIAYREGALPPAQREAVQEHLSLCARCTGLLRELRDFEAAAARGDAGPESLRREAWESLVQRLPAVRPFSPREPPPRRRLPRFVIAAVAALLLAVLGFATWTAITRLEQRDRQRDAEIATLRSTLAKSERELDMARRQTQDLDRVRELEARVAELTSALEESRRRAPEPRGQAVVASRDIRDIEVSVSPRFAVRGQEDPESGLLRGQGTVNPLRIAPQTNRFTVALSLADRPVYGEYRLELMDGDGEVLWSAHRPAKSLLGDAGTKVSVSGVGPGLYRLRIEGLQAEGSALLGEYILKVE